MKKAVLADQVPSQIRIRSQRMRREAGARIVVAAIAVCVSTCACAAVAPGVAVEPGQPAHPAQASRWRISDVLRNCRVSDSLSSVVATGRHDAWALGQPNGGGAGCGSDVERWDGVRWRRLTGAGSLGFGLPLGNPVLAASSARSAWIFPAVTEFSGTYNTAERWNGRSWRVIRFPVKLAVDAAVALSQRNVWAFGQVSRGAKSVPYATRFDGRRWRRAQVPAAPVAASTSRLAACGPWGRQSGPLPGHWPGRPWWRCTGPDGPGA